MFSFSFPFEAKNALTTGLAGGVDKIFIPVYRLMWSKYVLISALGVRIAPFLSLVREALPRNALQALPGWSETDRNPKTRLTPRLSSPLITTLFMLNDEYNPCMMVLSS